MANLELNQLIIYHELKEKQPIKLYMSLLEALENHLLEAEILNIYSDLIVSLLKQPVTEQVGDLWQNYLLDQLLAELELDFLPASDLIAQELKIVYRYFSCNLSALQAKLRNAVGEQSLLTDYEKIVKPSQHLYASTYEEQLLDCKKRLLNSADWAAEASFIRAFYDSPGTGHFAKYWGFIWDNGELNGIKNLETVELNHFVGYEEQRKELLANTEQFVKGYGANNVLLYGARGTGKSSSIKVLFTCFGQQGLRIIELAKHQLVELPALIKQIKNVDKKFIIFIDDLSFEPEETDYKYMKAILEGGLEVQPKNILIYATSNRRHLIREFKSERELNEDLHQQDTRQEKLSLADRFGLTITFSAPGEKEYLQIVEKLAEKRGLQLEQSKLYTLALQWQMWHNGLSGRTAKQFIEDLAGKMQL